MRSQENKKTLLSSWYQIKTSLFPPKNLNIYFSFKWFVGLKGFFFILELYYKINNTRSQCPILRSLVEKYLLLHLKLAALKWLVTFLWILRSKALKNSKALNGVSLPIHFALFWLLLLATPAKQIVAGLLYWTNILLLFQSQGNTQMSCFRASLSSPPPKAPPAVQAEAIDALNCNWNRYLYAGGEVDRGNTQHKFRSWLSFIGQPWGPILYI